MATQNTGSFNLNEFREWLANKVGETYHEVHEKDQRRFHDQTFALLRQFGKVLWVERSQSVGRDCVLTPKTCPEIFKVVDQDPPLSQLIQLWNTTTVVTKSKQISELKKQVAQVIPTDIEQKGLQELMQAEETHEKLKKTLTPRKIMSGVPIAILLDEVI